METGIRALAKIEPCLWKDKVLGGEKVTARGSAAPAGRRLQAQVRRRLIDHDSSLLYSACVPIQNQTTPSGLSLPSAR